MNIINYTSTRVQYLQEHEYISAQAQQIQKSAHTHHSTKHKEHKCTTSSEHVPFDIHGFSSSSNTLHALNFNSCVFQSFLLVLASFWYVVTRETGEFGRNRVGEFGRNRVASVC